MKPRRKVQFAVIASCLVSASIAGAQEGPGGVGGGAVGPSFGPAFIPESPPQDGPAAQGKDSVKLFDAFRSVVAYQLDVGPIWSRRASETTPLSRRTNLDHKAPLDGEIAIGSYYQTPSKRGPFFLTSEQATSLQILDSKSFSWSLFLNKLGGGLRFGPFEIEGKVAVSVLSVDIMHAQPSIQLLSPRIEAAVGLHLGRFRVDISGHSEYLWRWFGPDYYVRGINIGFRLDRVRPKSPFPGGPPE